MSVAFAQYVPFTVADLADTPDDGQRYEIQDGVLVVTPPPSFDHNLVSDVVRDVLRGAAPEGLFVVTGVGVQLGSDQEFRIPDVVVSSGRPQAGGLYLAPDQVLAAVEVVSPESRTTDRTTKPEVYAAAGITCMWRVETDRFPGQLPGEQLPVVFVLRLGPAGNEVVARLSAGSVGTAPLPFPVAFDPATLLD